MRMQLFNTTPANLTFEVRTGWNKPCGKHKITDYKQDDSNGTIDASFQLKDLIEGDTEYMLVILADVNGKTVRYYTRIVWTEDDSRYHVDEKLNFVSTFHNKTFDKNQAQDLSSYLETNSEGDNSCFHKVDIHSSLLIRYPGGHKLTYGSGGVYYRYSWSDRIIQTGLSGDGYR